MLLFRQLSNDIKYNVRNIQNNLFGTDPSLYDSGKNVEPFYQNKPRHKKIYVIGNFLQYILKGTE